MRQAHRKILNFPEQEEAWGGGAVRREDVQTNRTPLPKAVRGGGGTVGRRWAGGVGEPDLQSSVTPITFSPTASHHRTATTLFLNFWCFHEAKTDTCGHTRERVCGFTQTHTPPDGGRASTILTNLLYFKEKKSKACVIKKFYNNNKLLFYIVYFAVFKCPLCQRRSGVSFGWGVMSVYGMY